MSKATVGIVRCPDYRPEELNRAMGRLLELIGGLTGVVKPNDSVLLKINHLGNHPIEGAVNTHPGVVSSFAGTLKPVTSNIMVADGLDSSDEGPFVTSGFSEMCREEGLNLFNFRRGSYRGAAVESPHALAQVPIPASAAEADLVVSIPKLKTHILTVLTGAVKNNYGYPPLEIRLRLHREHIGPADFSGAVVDVYAACKPGLVVMDAIDALEGNGPSRGGRPRRLGLLLAGFDGVAVDAVASAVIGLDPMSVATTRLAHERGLGVGDLSQIEVVGEAIQGVRCEDFALPGGQLAVISLADRLPGSVARLVGKVAASTRQWPDVVTSRCTGCGVCVEHCPQEAVTLVDGKAHINTDDCISCFCCLEFCPSDALRPVRSTVGGLLAVGVKCASGAVKAVRKVFSIGKS